MDNFFAQMAAAPSPMYQNTLRDSPSPSMNQTVTKPRVPYALPQGMVVAGNIKDPSISPKDWVSNEFVHHGYHLETVLPRRIGNKLLSNKQAVERYRQTGEHFGAFGTPEDAAAHANTLAAHW